VSIFLPSWSIPTAFTAAIWVWGLWPRPRDYCAYGVDGVLYGGVSIIGTLFVWLVYFAVLYFWR
jgi:hypothetical protein